MFRTIGCDYSAAAAQPNATWLAEGVIQDEATATGDIEIVRLENVGSHKLADALLALTDANSGPSNPAQSPVAVGLDFPFSLPLPLARILLAKQSSAPSWLELAEFVAGHSYEEFQKLVQDARLPLGGEIKRVADTLTDPKGQSPMHQINPGMLKMTWQGMAMLLTLFKHGLTIEPFGNNGAGAPASAQVYEVYPAAILKTLGLPYRKYKGRTTEAIELRRQILNGLADGALRSVNCYGQSPARLVLTEIAYAEALRSDDALDAVIAALGAAYTRMKPNETGPRGHISRELIELEGWIYVPYQQTLPERRL